MKDTAIFTVSIGKEFEKISKITHPLMKKYANKTNSDFIVCNEIKNSTYPHFRKFYINDLFIMGYKRILFLDTDIIVKENSPNILEIVPEDCFGIYDESNMNFLKNNDRLKRWTNTFIVEYNKILEENNLEKVIPTNEWGKTYYNSGVMVVSKENNIFNNIPVKEIKLSGIHDQNFVNLLLNINNIKIYKLNKDFNFRYSEMKDINNGYFIHFNGIKNRFQHMKKLMEKIK